jgi:hypothetical protein
MGQGDRCHRPTTDCTFPIENGIRTITSHTQGNLHGNESCGSIKGGRFIGQLRDYQLLKKDSTS